MNGQSNEYSIPNVIILLVLNSLCVSGRNIFIYLATPLSDFSYRYLKLGWDSFVDSNCTYQNCFITDNEMLDVLSDLTEFDAVIFDAVSLYKNKINFPSSRSMHQRYILSGTEASSEYPLSTRYNSFFNWTWSYILDSDIACPNIVIMNEFDEIIGPKVDMNWKDINDMEKPSRYVKYKLRNKKIAAAWIVPKCEERMTPQSLYVQQLRRALIEYDLTIDVFGECGNVKCLKRWPQTCMALIEHYYYFYLAFEDSVSFDYVTEKLLIPLQHFAVPIVFGGANYSRFMPDGTYLDALALGPERLAQEMYDIISDKNQYYNMFRWHRHYSYHLAEKLSTTKPVCKLCAYLNEMRKSNEITIYTDIVRWFNECKDWPKEKNEKNTENLPDVDYI